MNTLEELEDYDPDDLANSLKRIMKERQELQEQEGIIRRKLAQIALDKEGRILETNYGAFKARKRPGYRRWDRDGLARTLYTIARQGTYYADEQGEIQHEPEYRVYDTFKRCFSLSTPKLTGLREFEIDPEEYYEQVGEPYWDIEFL